MSFTWTLSCHSIHHSTFCSLHLGPNLTCPIPNPSATKHSIWSRSITVYYEIKLLLIIECTTNYLYCIRVIHTIFLFSYATNHMYHIANYYKLRGNLLKIHKLTKEYLLDTCVLSLLVTTVLANSWHAKLLPKALQCIYYLKLMTVLSWSCWQELHNYCHSWNIDCVITDWLIYFLRLRTSSLHHLALFDTIIQNSSFYDVTWAKTYNGIVDMNP